MYERNYRERVLKQELAAPTPRSFPWRKALIMLGALIVLGGFVFLTRAPWQRVRVVHVTGTEVADPEDVSVYVLTMLEGNRLYVLPRASTIVLSTNAIEKRLHAAFPRFKTVSVHRDGLHSLAVSVEEYKGVYLWCDQDCFFMDERGIVFAPAPYFSGSAYMRIKIGEQAGLPFTPITQEQLEVVKLLTDRLQTIMIEPTEFDFVSPYELVVQFMHNGAPAEIRIDPGRDIQETLDALYAGMRAESFIHLYLDETKKLEYIDLRFNNKMVYKFQ